MIKVPGSGMILVSHSFVFVLHSGSCLIFLSEFQITCGAQLLYYVMPYAQDGPLWIFLVLTLLTYVSLYFRPFRDSPSLVCPISILMLQKTDFMLGMAFIQCSFPSASSC